MGAARIRALLAEDETLVAEFIAAGLESVGVSVVGRASDGRAAVELACSLRPDVVLMDVQMPELDGIEAAREIQQRCPTPVVILSGYAEQQVALRAAEAGVGAYVVKPANPDEVLRAITISRTRFADLMELRRLNAELREALASVKTMSAMLPICTNCKSIRDDEGYWRRVEAYIQAHTDTRFSHSICPECMPKVYPPDEYPYLYEPESREK